MKVSKMDEYIVYLITYFDYKKDSDDCLIVSINKDKEDINPTISEQIFNYLYGDEKYQTEISIIKIDKLFEITKDKLARYNFLEIV